MAELLLKLLQCLLGLNFPLGEKSQFFNDFILVEVLFGDLNFDFVTLDQKSLQEVQVELVVGVCLLETSTNLLAEQLWSLL